MNKFFVLILVIGLVSEMGIIFLLLDSQPADVVAQISPIQNSVNQEIVFFAVGDIMLGRGVEYMVENYGKGDFCFPFSKLTNELNKADILFGNLEGPMSDRGERVGSIYSFRFLPEAIKGLKCAGFDILSLANNHTLDYTRIAFEDTLNILKENAIEYIGAGFSEQETFSVKIIEIKETKIGFLAYTNLGPEIWQAKGQNAGMAWVDRQAIQKIKNDIAEAKQVVDVLVVSLHAGKEYSPIPDSFQIDFSQNCIEAGADLILGHHSHTIQPNEKYKDGWIAYGLGNFVFDQGFSKETMEGLLLKVIIENKKITQVIPQKVRMNKYFQPELVNEIF